MHESYSEFSCCLKNVFERLKESHNTIWGKATSVFEASGKIWNLTTVEMLTHKSCKAVERQVFRSEYRKKIKFDRLCLRPQDKSCSVLSHQRPPFGDCILNLLDEMELYIMGFCSVEYKLTKITFYFTLKSILIIKSDFKIHSSYNFLLLTNYF